MRKLLLVGDKPSSKNTDSAIAFIGTASHTRLQKWLAVILDNEAKIQLINRVDPRFDQHLIYATLNSFQIIALGEEASKALIAYGVTNFFKLPHPSGRNRKLNDKQYEMKILQECKTWLERG